MSRWVRLWEDMPDDPKWLVVRYRASQSVTGVTVGHVISVFVKMMACADSHGNLVNWSDEDVAVRLEYETKQVSAIREAMQEKVLDGNYLKGWEKRQPKREDDSTERVRAFRANRNALKRSETHEERNETQRNAPEEKRIETESSFLEKKKQKTRAGENDFDNFWGRNPNKVGKAAARKQFEAALRRATLAEILEGVDRYVRDKPPDRPWCNPATWLNQDRWMDQPAIAGKMNGHTDPAKVPLMLVFVAEDTPQWDAWDAFYRTTKGKSPPKTNRANTFERGWYFPTEWPPEELKYDQT